MDKPETFTAEQIEAVAWKFTWIGVMLGTIGTSIMWLLLTVAR